MTQFLNSAQIPGGFEVETPMNRRPPVTIAKGDFGEGDPKEVLLGVGV